MLCSIFLLKEISKDDPIRTRLPKFSVSITEKLWRIRVKQQKENNIMSELVYVTPFVSVCTGHHGVPRVVAFEGQETFPGEIVHSVKYKSAKINQMEGKRVLLVGIGNSSVDVADNLVNEGK